MMFADSAHQLLQVAMAFVASVAYAVLYHVPKKALFLIGFVGTGAWLAQKGAMAAGLTQIGAAFTAALLVAAASEWLARWQRMPVTVFTVGGIVPLVPGSKAYGAMREFVTGNDLEGITRGAETFLIAAAVAAGLVLAGTVVRFIDRRVRDARKSAGNRSQA
ncbi:MAG TPA: threonine/serine exporter family protein [Bacilli bacterium]|nr:threonine/serine exporter family protein [Bacilli bacterium]